MGAGGEVKLEEREQFKQLTIGSMAQENKADLGKNEGIEKFDTIQQY